MVTDLLFSQYMYDTCVIVDIDRGVSDNGLIHDRQKSSDMINVTP